MTPTRIVEALDRRRAFLEILFEEQPNRPLSIERAEWTALSEAIALLQSRTRAERAVARMVNTLQSTPAIPQDLPELTVAELCSRYDNCCMAAAHLLITMEHIDAEFARRRGATQPDCCGICKCKITNAGTTCSKGCPADDGRGAAA